MRLVAFCSIAIFASGVASSAEELTFDAASVKLASPDLLTPFPITGGPGTNDPSRFSAPRIGMYALLRRAFEVGDDQLLGSAWRRGDPQHPADTPSYSVLATMPGNTTKEQFQKMLQNLLIERFHLVFHHQTRNYPGYELVVDKGGPKFKEVIPTQVAKVADRSPRSVLTGPRGEDGFPAAAGSRRFSQYRPGGQAREKFQEWTMAEFAMNLTPLIAASEGKSPSLAFPETPMPRVADKTGLSGKYSFVLEYYNANLAKVILHGVFGRGDAPPGADNGGITAATEPGSAFPNIFVAVQKELGLRLNKTADVPLDVIVVDSVDKAPTEN